MFRAFLENWDSCLNTYYTDVGEIGLTLWDLYELTKLLIVEYPYEEYSPMDQKLYAIANIGAYVYSDHLRHMFKIYHELAMVKKATKKRSEGQLCMTFDEWIEYFIDEAHREKRFTDVNDLF